MEQFTCFVTCPHIRADHIHLQTASQLQMLNLKKCSSSKVSACQVKRNGSGFTLTRNPRKSVKRLSYRREDPLSLIYTVSRENTFDRSLTRCREARQAARHRWHSRWGKSSQLVWSQCCILPRCFQGLSWTDLQWWILSQAKVLLHTKDGERPLISLTLQSSLRLSPHLSGSKGNEKVPLVKASHVLQCLPLGTHYGITLPVGNPEHLPSYRASKASCTWKPEKHDVHFWQIQPGIAQTRHHCPV